MGQISNWDEKADRRDIERLQHLRSSNNLPLNAEKTVKVVMVDVRRDATLHPPILLGCTLGTPVESCQFSARCDPVPGPDVGAAHH